MNGEAAVETIGRRMRDVPPKLMNAVHRAVLAVTGGKVLSKPFGMPVVELHTVGRKSGLPRTNLLTTPVHDDRRIVLVASKGGDDRDPDWFRNLMAAPETELVLDGERIAIHARAASPAERAELWPEVVRAYRGYAKYQQRTTREIPLVICEKR